MKLLKLDARFEDARRVARCLVGSPVVDHYLSAHMEWGEEIYFSGVLNNSAFGVHNHENYVSMNPKTKFLLIPIDTLNFCPFMAMRDRVLVHGKDARSENFGLIWAIGTTDGRLSICIGSSSYYSYEIKLDLTPILQGELEGCEIVEVEQ